MQIEIFNDSSYPDQTINTKIISIVKKILKKEKTNLNKINIIITNDDYLKKLNKAFLKRNRTTNVIAFNLDELSEIYVSYNQASDLYELLYFVIHGLLHLLGYEHQTKTEDRRLEKKCLSYLKYV